MKIRLSLIVVALGLGTAVGCGGDDPPPPEPPGNAATFQGGMTAANRITPHTLDVMRYHTWMEEATADLSTLIWSRLTSPSTTRAGSTGCELLAEACTSGAVEVCVAADTASIDFLACVFDGELFDGTIAVTGNSLVLDLRVGDTTFAGGITVQLTETCVTQVFDNLTVSRPGVSTTQRGMLVACLGDAWPRGDLVVEIQTHDVGHYLFAIALDGSAVADMRMFDLYSGDRLGACTVDLAAASVSCVGS